MKKYNVKFVRDYEVQVEADSAKAAEGIALDALKQFPTGSCRLVSIHVEGYKEPALPDPPRNRPPGGTLGGGHAVVIPPLVDQIAEAA